MDELWPGTFPESTDTPAKDEEDVEVDEGEVWIRTVEAFVLDDATE